VKTPDTPFVHVIFSQVGAISCELRSEILRARLFEFPHSLGQAV